MTTSTKRDWVRIIGITGATLVVAGAVTIGGLWAATATGLIEAPTRMAMMGGRGGMMGGRGGMYAQAAGDQAYLEHLLAILQSEQAVANLLADTNAAAKAIAESRAKDIAVLTELQKSWYPDAATASTAVTTATIDDLQEMVLHNAAMLERLSGATFERPELAAWVTQHMIQRASEIVTMYAPQS